jgi:hypothetical protein
MYKRFATRIVLTFCCLPTLATADSSAPNPVLTGTVNIVLANANGIVVLTDSNQTGRYSTGEPFTSPLSGQKLFRIDDRTVCSVAGFGSTSLPTFPEFTASIGGILDSYAAELRAKGGTHSFHEKLTSLDFFLEFRLSGIGNLQHLKQAQLGDYGVELIMAGYDLDGTTKLGKIVVDTRLSADGIFSPVLKKLTEATVGRDLAHETAGIGGAAVENILAYPAQFAEEPEIGKYSASKASDRGSSLSAAELEALAKSLARHSAFANSRYIGDSHKMWWPVGGRNQIAILEKGLIQKIDQQLFEERGPHTPNVIMQMQNKFHEGPVAPNPAPDILLMLYVKNLFQDSQISLDGTYFFDNEFDRVTLFYDGGVLGFDPSNRVTGCALILGPHGDRRSAAAEELVTRFHCRVVD